MSITLVESKRLIALEATISKGIATFIQVGEALAEIRDTQLYRVEHKTFEAYCREKWNMSKRHCDRLIASSEVVVALGPIGPKPASESQARPLTKLPPEKQPEAWSKAVESANGKQPTAKQVEAAVESVAPKAKATRLPNYKPSNGLQYADMAIAELQTIHPQDTQRAEALAKVAKWIADHQ